MIIRVPGEFLRVAKGFAHGLAVADLREVEEGVGKSGIRAGGAGVGAFRMRVSHVRCSESGDENIPGTAPPAVAATRVSPSVAHARAVIRHHGTVTERLADPDLLIEFDDVSLVRSGKTLIGPVDWRVELDERWVIIGPNGAGKTSLLRMAGALDHPSTGEAFVVGERLGRTDIRELTTRIGFVSSAFASRVPADEKVADLVISAGYAVVGRWREEYGSADRAQAADTLESMGAEHLADRTFGTLSEGERKRVLIARGLMTDPELLLLDEPAAGLDLGGREELVDRLGALAADPDAPAMVLITHHVEEIPPGFTNILMLSEGGAVAQGALEDTLTSENLSATFRQNIVLTSDGDRYFARRARRAGGHRRV